MTLNVFLTAKKNLSVSEQVSTGADEQIRTADLRLTNVCLSFLQFVVIFSFWLYQAISLLYALLT